MSLFKRFIHRKLLHLHVSMCKKEVNRRYFSPCWFSHIGPILIVTCLMQFISGKLTFLSNDISQDLLDNCINPPIFAKFNNCKFSWLWNQNCWPLVYIGWQIDNIHYSYMIKQEYMKWFFKLTMLCIKTWKAKLKLQHFL